MTPPGVTGEVVVPTGPGLSYGEGDDSSIPQPGDDDYEHVDPEDLPACGEQGPVTESCEDDGPAAPIPSADVLAAGNAAVRAFSLEWVTIDHSESKSARAARLRTVGASDEVANQVSLLTRPDSNYTTLTADVKPRDPMYVSFNRVMLNGNEYLASTNVTAEYSIAAGTQSRTWNMGGSLIVTFDSATGKIVSVKEIFKTLADMA